MSQTSYDTEIQQATPATTHKPNPVPEVLTRLSSPKFFVTPMGKGRPARQVENKEASEEEPMAGIGLSILGSIIGGALGLGPMFEIAFEAVKTGLEIGENQIGSRNLVEDVNLNPAALLDPSRAFNFKAMPKALVLEDAAKEDESRPKRSWNSGEGSFLLAQSLAGKRHKAVASNPIMSMKGFGTSTTAKK